MANVESPETAPQGPGTSGVKGEAVGQAKDLKNTTVHHATELTRDARQQATHVLRDVRSDLETHGESQTQRLAVSLHDAGRQLQDMADGAEPGTMTQVTHQVAGGVERVAGRLEEGGLQGLGDDVRSFARRQPLLFIAAAGAAGFVVTRLLRNASSLQSEPELPDAQLTGSGALYETSTPLTAGVSEPLPRTDIP